MIITVQTTNSKFNCKNSLELPLRQEKSLIIPDDKRVTVLKIYETEQEAKEILNEIREVYKKGIKEYILK